MSDGKKFKIFTAATALIAVLALTHSFKVDAATTPSLGAATTYGVLASTYTNTSATTINGDVGFTTGPAVAPGGTHNNYGSGAPYATAGADQENAATALAAQACTFTWNAAVDLSIDVTHGPAGVFTPGVYCSIGAMSVGGPITLSGSGTYIFRAVGALDSTAGSIVTLADGASACDIFWTPSAATTLGATTTFSGTVIDPSAITVGANTTWTGRALAFSGTVTTDTDTITVPTCTGSLTVIKTVINDNGRTQTVADFPLFVNGTPVVSGTTNTLAAPASYTVTETIDPNYLQTFSGTCDANGNLTLTPGDVAVCVVTNNDIGAPIIDPPVPPLIDLVKVPSPLTLPGGPGPVTYTYTLTNIGSTTVTDLALVGDSCSPITLVSGDLNANAALEVSETWTYTCATTLSATHTNTVVATGQANGLTGIDIASATVVVGSALVPPLVHVTKVPSPLTLLAGGGTVIYTEKVSNPGAVALTNVRLSDDKCSPLTFITGDTNNDSRLDTTETWAYTCQTALTATTLNTATATGQANGLTATDFAMATVVVAGAAPVLPSTGFGPPD